MKKHLVKTSSLLLREVVHRTIIDIPSRRGFTAYDYLRTRSFHSSSRLLAVKQYLLADIGEGITECQVISWYVKPGDWVEQFDAICEVQSDKASVEITSRWDGVIKKLHYDTDDMAQVGQPLVDIEVDGLEGEETSSASAEMENVAEEVLAGEMQERAGPTEKVTPTTEFDSDSPPKSEAASEADSALLTPGVRQLIKDLNLNAAEIQGTGRNGRILKEDVHRHIAQNTSSQTSRSSQPSETSSTTPQDRVVDLTATQNAMFKTMTRSLAIPHFLYTHSVDFTALNAQRKSLNANAGSKDPSSPKLTALPFIMKALSQVFHKFPLLNSHLETKDNSSKPQVLLKGSHDFGNAVDTPHGLVVPVVRSVQDRSISSLAVETERLSGLAQAGKLTPGDMQGATFTVSNIGSIGGGVVSPIIVAPMVGMLAIGRMSPTFAGAKDEVDVEKNVRREEVILSWSADHRILDGATVARCAEVVKRSLEDAISQEIR